MTAVISMLIRQAQIFADLGGNSVRIELLNTRKLLPIARVSISSSLAIIGALALFPLIGAETGVDLMEILPGAIATLISLICIFFIPVWPTHRRIAAVKKAQLAVLDNRIEHHFNNDQQIESGSHVDAALASLLVYRREIREVTTWPFDLGNVAKLSFYLIIPPLTWVAAALIERLVDALSDRKYIQQVFWTGLRLLRSRCIFLGL